jgi:hypothetical protein
MQIITQQLGQTEQLLAYCPILRKQVSNMESGCCNASSQNISCTSCLNFCFPGIKCSKILMQMQHYSLMNHWHNTHIVSVDDKSMLTVAAKN